jgi:hypothetical protein
VLFPIFENLICEKASDVWEGNVASLKLLFKDDELFWESINVQFILSFEPSSFQLTKKELHDHLELWVQRK